MDPIFLDYLDLLDEADSARQTYTNNRRSFELFDEFLAKHELDAKAVRLADLRAWLKEMVGNYKASTVSRHAINIRAAYKHAHELAVIDFNPTAGMQKLIPRPVDNLPETFDTDELRALHGAIETDREEQIFHSLLWTGARAAELRGLRWESRDRSYVDLDNAQLCIFGKNSKIRFVPLHPILEKKMRQWSYSADTDVVFPSCRGETMSHQTWTTCVIDLMERAGVEEGRSKSHRFRKTLNTNLQRQRVPETVLDALFGWAPATVRTKHYSGVASDEVRQAILKAYADDPVVPEQTKINVYDGMIETLQAEIERLTALKASAATV